MVTKAGPPLVAGSYLSTVALLNTGSRERWSEQDGGFSLAPEG